MPLSNLHSFHFGQMLQNAMALPEHVYQNINNHSSINRALHQHDKLRRRKARKSRNTKKTFAHNKTMSQDNQNFTPSPFPERREPVVIDSEVKPKVPATTIKQATPSTATIQQEKPQKKPEAPVARNKMPTKTAQLKAQALLKKQLELKKQIHLKKLAHLKKQAQLKREALTRNQAPVKKTKAALKSHPAKKPTNNTSLPKKKSIEERWLKAKPTTNPYGEPKVSPQKHPHPEKPAQRATWKSGRGCVEKIDKHTGEIVHLAEESS